MELGKEATLVIQIPALLLPTLGSRTVVFLPSPRFPSPRLWDRAPATHSKCKPSARGLALFRGQEGESPPPALPRYTHSMCTRAPGGGEASGLE